MLSDRKFITSGSEEYGETRCVVSIKNRSSEETFSDREDFSSGHQQVLGNNEPQILSSGKFCEISFFEGHRDHMLAEAKAEILKQESKVDSLDICIRELQRQARSHRLDTEGANCGYEESRREQARLQEELAPREKALQDARFRNIHEMEELKRAQELRVEKFSAQKSRESLDTIQKLISQIQELQERVNCKNDSTEFQDVQSICSGK